MEAQPALAPGLTARVELVVSDSDTAQTLGSGDVPMLATPRVLALAETATVAATARQMPSGQTTVGFRVELSHVAPVPIGRSVAAQATLATVDGRRLLFEVHVTEVPATADVPYADRRVVAEGRIERMLVDRRRFLSTAFE
ncbi:thioesterase family protein [Catenuloplanes japonicus]|uniref:thioesterase family protein n=1 Tax=Catenuloplanes japonicus TaxID=33876 RepID=UPI000527E5A4|nr:hotdog domain-containing protein [Catenuloplanes japonicus]